MFLQIFTSLGGNGMEERKKMHVFTLYVQYAIIKV